MQNEQPQLNVSLQHLNNYIEAHVILTNKIPEFIPVDAKVADWYKQSQQTSAKAMGILTHSSELKYRDIPLKVVNEKTNSN